MAEVLVVADAGGVGLGHVSRCIALAQAFRALGRETEFTVTDAVADRLVAAAGFRRRQDVHGSWDVAVVDSYTRPHLLLRRLRPRARTLVAIDDLHLLRSEDARVLVRPSLGERSFVSVLGGPRHVMLRRDYWNPTEYLIRPRPSRVLVVLGSEPPLGTLERVLGVVADRLPDARVEVLLGASRARHAPHRLRASRVWRGIFSLRPLLRRVDLVITAGGQTACEALAVGVPTMVLGTALNQARNLSGARALGLAIILGWHNDDHWQGVLERRLPEVWNDVALRRRLSVASRRVVDGKGAGRVAAQVARLA